jgi:hypothetical protein
MIIFSALAKNQDTAQGFEVPKFAYGSSWELSKVIHWESGSRTGACGTPLKPFYIRQWSIDGIASHFLQTCEDFTTSRIFSAFKPLCPKH